MTKTPYRITVRGTPSPRVASILEPLRPETADAARGCTSFVGDIVDQSHLYGVLGCLERHDVELVSLVPLEERPDWPAVKGDTQ